MRPHILSWLSTFAIVGGLSDLALLLVRSEESTDASPFLDGSDEKLIWGAAFLGSRYEEEDVVARAEVK
jgi:hypothetical protein